MQCVIYYYIGQLPVAPQSFLLLHHEQRRIDCMEKNKARTYQNSRNWIKHLIIQNQWQVEDFKYNTAGKPIMNTQNQYLSVTHSAQLWAVAFSTVPIGIDCESKTPKNLERFADYFQIKSTHLPDIQKDWMLREAYAKLSGASIMRLRKKSIQSLLDSENIQHRILNLEDYILTLIGQTHHPIDVHTYTLRDILK
ncbi:hypothetical protein MMH89_04275 [Candidatus Comchoanobacter bicostacola]|uniref:4'-phosphopantetheinyl transferase domain-containing protein n=1 Tax=Candidatus Comchoanobacter bicostacola TaxID=2919598 RepID=A0ABY5DJC9_9GAMM|nr:hypothetical protein [Candidatus Comchoanobacter bicostacola]UTC24434.1 hypothetical protein MMH89_04275 [Candidatus Comchoanobacter bicostacola]